MPNIAELEQALGSRQQELPAIYRLNGDTGQRPDWFNGDVSYEVGSFLPSASASGSSLWIIR